ncbi:MAG: hypothetical protein P0Y48_12280 [Candidatus Microbacterium phytovorans]|uniref:TPM domain-containing protein n=1 Tax=Candidatus Microbacterium phytovorans TaxID=3121374 RepID=A0AAJ6B4X5_9MICO|nr:hypothetical protein [Microbacterium sp.]WEK13221.1 MAG: hypothetical protein P0Y48_12280 [Microbacterium sp.]
MSDGWVEIARWGIPAAVVFGATALAVVLATWLIRRSRRSPRARAAADAQRADTGVALVALDDAVEELDLEVALSGALYDGGAPASLRRALLLARHTRDDAFALLRGLEPDAHPTEIARVARLLRGRIDAAAAQIAAARSEHSAWMGAHRSAASQVEDARARLDAFRAELGDPEALLSDLGGRVDASEIDAAKRAAADATRLLAEAESRLTDAAERAADPTRSALPVLAAAERLLRQAQESARILEEQHRLVTDAERAVDDEVEAAREALRQAERVRADLEPEEADRLGTAIREVTAAIDAVEPEARRRPTHAVTMIARARDRLDLALGDARTAQQRLRGARTALPGTLAAARAAVARAETAASHANADARVRLSSAQAELAAARSAQDPVTALDGARRALRHAEDAIALADYDRSTGR